ncbi:MAG: MBL fold metallo-hydrolase [Bacillota bacterium]
MEKMPIITISLPTPFPVGDINSYLIMDDPVTIIDPGPFYGPAEKKLAEALEQYDLEMSDIKRVFITHGHPDHYGMAGKIQEVGGAEVLIRDEEIQKIKPEKHYKEQMRRLFFSTGISGEALAIGASLEKGSPYAHPVEKFSSITGKKSLDFSGFSFNLIHMPGHSGGHMCLYWEEENIVLSGDALLPEISSIPSFEFDPGMKNLRYRSLAGVMDTMDRFSRMKPFVCLPGHGEAIEDPVELARSRIDFHRNRLDEIFRLVPEGKENSITPYGMSRLYYPNVQGFDKVLAIFEVLSHLDFLADEGRIIEWFDQNGVSYFYRPAGSAKN